MSASVFTSERYANAVALAVGLGGWKVDPSDPWKAPYTPVNAAFVAAERYLEDTGLTEYQLVLVVDTIRCIVAAAVNMDLTTDEQIAEMRHEWSNERAEA